MWGLENSNSEDIIFQSITLKDKFNKNFKKITYLLLLNAEMNMMLFYSYFFIWCKALNTEIKILLYDNIKNLLSEYIVSVYSGHCSEWKTPNG